MKVPVVSTITDYQAKYYAYELTKRSPSDSLEKLTGAVASAQVDLNPHQVDAALFAFQSPLSKGALFALDGWADDQIVSSEKALRDMKKTSPRTTKRIEQSE
jgi:hypothetical protein